jgi:methionyl-tRNA synthetase
MAKKFYLTTTAPYVNAEPHIGFALEIVQADALGRYRRLLGEKVAFGFGTDEHGVKIYRKALEKKLAPQKYCDQSVVTWNQLKQALNLSYTHFIRTTDPKHIQAAQELWRRCLKNGDIYKKFYKTKYCSGCELEKTDSELVNAHCPLHPNLALDLIEEENYFFRFSKFQKPLLEFYDRHPDFVIPQSRFQEIKTFVKSGLQDFSLSRLTKKMPWGVPVPDDPNQVMYVWFDALTFYLSNLGWPEDEKTFKEYWPVVQLAGKDNLRQQSAIWQAMLLSAGLPCSKQIFIHGFMTKDGQKISKSLGNTIDPLELTKKYGTDAVRYYLLAKTHPFNDSDFTVKDFETSYNADLANGLGNLVSRVAKLCQQDGLNGVKDFRKRTTVSTELDRYEFNQALVKLWEELRKIDLDISQFEPWKKINKEREEKLLNWAKRILEFAWQLQIFLPQTAAKIEKIFSGKTIKIEQLLFPRL